MKIILSIFIFVLFLEQGNAQVGFNVVGSGSYATDMNDNGTLVGGMNTGGYWDARGILFSNGVRSTASSYYNQDYNSNYPAWTTEVSAINNLGQWGGIYGTGGVAFQFSGSFPVNNPTGEYATINAINDSGTAVGANNQNPKAKTWTSTGSSWLPVLGGRNPSAYDSARSAAYDINNSGLIVGDSEPYYTSLGLPRKAVYWQSGSIFTIGTLGGEYSSARAVNNNNLIVGASDTITERHAFSYLNGSLLDLGTLGGTESVAFDVNDNGWIVGKSKTLSGDWAGFVYKDSLMYDLNSWLEPSLRDGWTISEAVAINENGQIAANGTKNGTSSALFITIPEPSALSLLAVGLGGLAMIRRRRS
jgi:probable HAF family extracellular repeat protein